MNAKMVGSYGFSSLADSFLSRLLASNIHLNPLLFGECGDPLLHTCQRAGDNKGT